MKGNIYKGRRWADGGTVGRRLWDHNFDNRWRKMDTRGKFRGAYIRAWLGWVDHD